MPDGHGRVTDAVPFRKTSILQQAAAENGATRSRQVGDTANGAAGSPCRPATPSSPRQKSPTRSPDQQAQHRNPRSCGQRHVSPATRLNTKPAGAPSSAPAEHPREAFCRRISPHGERYRARANTARTASATAAAVKPYSSCKNAAGPTWPNRSLTPWRTSGIPAPASASTAATASPKPPTTP